MNLKNDELKILKKIYEGGDLQYTDLSDYVDEPGDFQQRMTEYIIFDSQGMNVDLHLTAEGKELVEEETDVKPKKKTITEVEEEKIMELLKDPKLIQRIKRKLDEWIIGENINKVFVYLVGLSSQTASPISLIVTGDYSAGKSYLVKNVLKLFEWKRDYFDATRGTDNVLDRIGQENSIDLNNKIIYLAEFQGDNQFMEHMKLGLSEGELTLWSTKKDEDGNFVPEMIRTEMNVSFITTHLNLNMAEDMLSRTFITSCDLSEEQTGRILEFQTLEAILGEDVMDGDDGETRKYRKMIEYLEPQPVSVPFAKSLKKVMPKGKIRVRRDFKKLINLIQVSAFLHQYQRPTIEVKGKERLVATIHDLMITSYIMEKCMGETILNVANYELKFYNKIKDVVDEDEDVTIADLADVTDKSPNTIYPYMRDLDSAGLVKMKKKPGEGNTNFYEIKEKTSTFQDLFEDFHKQINEDFTRERLENVMNKVGVEDIDFDSLYDEIKGYTELEFIENKEEEQTRDKLTLQAMDDKEKGMEPQTDIEELDNPREEYCAIGNHKTQVKYKVYDEEYDEEIYVCDAHIEEARGTYE